MSHSVKAMTRTIVLAVLVLALGVILSAGLAGCGDDASPSTSLATVTTDGGTPTTAVVDAVALMGKWYNEDLKETLEFTSDGKMNWAKDGGTPLTFTFTVQMDTIVFRQPNAPEDNRLPYVVNGDTLVMTDSEYGQLSYTRQQ